MWIILGLFFSLSAFALDASDTISGVKILRVLPDNIILLNRGLEDGIQRNDHAKLSNDVAGYSSRAICVRVSGDMSYWKLYRVPNSEAFSMDYTYTITGMADKEIPYPVYRLRDQVQKFNDPALEKKEDAGTDPFTIKPDLPEKLTERDLIQAEGPEQRKLFIEKALKQDQLKRDLTDYRFSVFASPFTKQSINQGESLRYGFRGGNIGSKFRVLTQFEQQQTRLTDPVTKESVSTRSTAGQVQFINHLSPSFSSLSLVNYNSQRFSALGTPDYQWQMGLIGFTWHIYESKTWEYMELSYIPLYDMRSTEILENGNTNTVKKNGVRHGFRFAVKTKINERVALENLLWVRPFQDPASWEIEGDNLNILNDLKLMFSLTENLFFDYNFIFQKDKLWRTLSGLPETNTVNSLNLRYDFDL